MEIERDRQRQLLRALANRYPDRVPLADLSTDQKSLIFDLAYLGELELVRCKFSRLADGGLELTTNPCITARGLDFLKNDGGSAPFLAS